MLRSEIHPRGGPIIPTDPPRATLAPVDRDQVQVVVGLVRRILGPDLVAAYLSGSALAGGLRPDSDLDLLVVTDRRLTDDERQALVAGLLPISGSRASPKPARSIELTVVLDGDVQPWRYPPLMELQYGDWLRTELERGDRPPGPLPNPDLAILVTTVLLGSEALVGPPAHQLLDAPPSGDLVRAMIDGIPGLLLDLDHDTRNVLLTFARIWTTIATGEIRPKDAAADWVLARLPEAHRPVLAHARAIYLGETPERWDDLRDRVGLHVDHVLAAIQAASEHPVSGPAATDPRGDP